MSNVKIIENLLRDELAATETYQQVFEKLRADASLGETESLLPIYENHKTAVSSLQTHVRHLGGTPTETSGVWGGWSKLMTGSANLLGKAAALEVLQAGEKIGQAEYEIALENKALPADFLSLIVNTLLPAQKSHILILDRLVAQVTT